MLDAMVSLSFSLSLSLTHSLTHSRSLTNTHTHTHTGLIQPKDVVHFVDGTPCEAVAGPMAFAELLRYFQTRSLFLLYWVTFDPSPAPWPSPRSSGAFKLGLFCCCYIRFLLTPRRARGLRRAPEVCIKAKRDLLMSKRNLLLLVLLRYASVSRSLLPL